MITLDHCRALAKDDLSAFVIDTALDDSIGSSVERGLQCIGNIGIQPGDLVVIKPNLMTSKSSPNSGVTTRVDVVDPLIRWINQHVGGCDIRIVESDSDGRIEDAYSKLGYTELRDKYDNLSLVDLGQETYYKMVMPSWAKTRLIEVPEILLNMNAFISVANLKRHNLDRITCIWKNAYGLPSDHLVRMKFHPFLKEVLFDLNLVFWPTLSIVDARIVLGGCGPGSGFPRRYGKMIISRNPLAADLAALRLIDESPRQIPTIGYAIRKLRVNPSEVTIRGDHWKPMRLCFVNPLAHKALRFSMWVRRFSVYIENTFFVGWLVSAGLRVGGGVQQFVGGGMQTLGTSIKTAWSFLTKLNVGKQTHG